MNLLILNTSDSQGGAAIATYRLHNGLCSIGINSQLLVQSKKTDDHRVIGPSGRWQKVAAVLRPHLDKLLPDFYRNREKTLFSSAWVPENLAETIAKSNPDIVHLFWVNSGFLKIETLRKIKQPIVWTLHDMWPFTGGCHYDDECGKFRKSCGNCPLLHSDKDSDLSRRIWARKQTAWSDVPMVIVATSHWLADMARSSSIFKNQRIEVIPNGIDTERYKPIDKKLARSVYNLPPNKRLILFSAFSATSDKRKGHQFLIPALREMSERGWGANTELVVIGALESQNAQDFGMKVHYLGHLHDEISQVLLYSAADVLVAPSMQENLSNTVMEAMACGTPVVAFDIGGMPDMVDHQLSGYLAKPFDSDDLADGITWVLEDKIRHDTLSQRARLTAVERYAVHKIADRYSALYRSLLK